MSTATLIDLPVELIQRISWLLVYERDVKTLQSASLTCKYLTPAFQEGVFSQVLLDVPIQKRPGTITGVEQFSSIIKTSPHLISYIRTLGILLTSQILLCRVLGDAVNVKRLRLTGQLFTGEWSSLEEETRTGIEVALRTHNINHLHLDAVRRLPLSLLMGCRTLRHLSLSSFEPDPKCLPILSSDELPIQLESLQLSLDEESLSILVEWLLHPQCAFDISHLKRLYLNTDFGDDDNAFFWRVIQKCYSSLETLMLDIIPNGHHEPDLDFAILTSLQTLRIRLMIGGVDEPMMVRNAFRSVDATKNSLQCIHIDMLCNDDYNDVDWVCDVFQRKNFPKTNICVTLYGCDEYIEANVSLEINDFAGDADNIDFNFSPADPYDNFLQFLDDD